MTRRLGAFLAGILGAAFISTAGLVDVAKPSYAATDGQPLLTGRLLTPEGTPASNVSVAVSRLDFHGASPDDASVDTILVGTSQTDAMGYFTVDAAEIDSDATYELSGVVGGDEIGYAFNPTDNSGATAASRLSGSSSARSPAARPAVVVLQAGTGALTTPTGAPEHVGARPSKMLASAVAPMADTDEDGGDFMEPPPDGYVQDPDGPDNSGIASPPTGYTEVQPENGKAPTKCGGVVQLSHIPNSTVFKMLPVRGVLTGAHSAQDYVYKTAHKTQAGGVLNVAGDLSDLGATGGGSDKWSQTIEWPYSKLGNDTTWALKVQWDFEKWQEWCTGLAGVPGGALKMDATQTLPWDVAGGSTHLATPMAVACNDTHPLDGLTKLSTSHTENFGGWFSIAGISLDTKTTQSTSTITTIRPDNTTAAGANERDPVYCSTAATMAGSAWIREKS